MIVDFRVYVDSKEVELGWLLEWVFILKVDVYYIVSDVCDFIKFKS